MDVTSVNTVSFEDDWFIEALKQDRLITSDEIAEILSGARMSLFLSICY